MATAAVTRSDEGRRAPGFEPGWLRQLLDGTLYELDGDDRHGPLVRASGIRMRMVIDDAGLTLDVAASPDDERNIEWSFDGALDGEPKLTLAMDSATANAYLQGVESLAIGIARGRVRFRGESNCALVFLPILRLAVEPYRRLIRAQHPALAL